MALRIDAPGFLDQAKRRLSDKSLLAGEDGDFCYVILDARRYDLTVLVCGGGGLTDTIAKMPRPPAAVINGQFVGGFRLRPEGQVVREHRLVHPDSRTRRFFLAQRPDASDARGFVVGEGDPWARVRQARAAFGGLGPVLEDGRPPPRLTAWAESIYERGPTIGRGVIAIDRKRHLTLLLVQRDLGAFGAASNAAPLERVRGWLAEMGIEDALFNDGSDSEALYAEGRWLVEPGLLKDAAMEFAIAFVDRRATRRVNVLAVDGTDTPDAAAFIRGIEGAPTLNYLPRNLALPVRRVYSALREAGRHDALDVWRTPGRAGARAAARVFVRSGTLKSRAHLFYVSSHASRHGQLYYHRGGGHRGPALTFADPWSRALDVDWAKGPLWILLVGCAAMALRYSRLVRLTRGERAGLIDRHRDIHGRKAAVPGLSDKKEAAFIVHHPGWRWYSKVLRESPVRGVLGYWYRSPGGEAGDVEIIHEFCERVGQGETLLDAWRACNHARIGFGPFRIKGAAAAWAAMVRHGCESDALATLEDAGLPRARGELRYFDVHTGEAGRPLARAYELANRADKVFRLGEVKLDTNAAYDEITMEKDAPGLGVRVTRENLLVYDDGVGPG